MAKANGLDAASGGTNTLMPCIFALAKHGKEPVDKWSVRTVKSLFEFQCHSESSTADISKSVRVEHGFTMREIESLDILNNIPNLLSFTFPGKETSGLYLSPKICSYPVDDWQVGHISLFDALDETLHVHCIICFGQNNYFVAFRNLETKQANTRKSIGSPKPKVWLFDGDAQHETNLTSHKDEKEMRTYIYDLLKKHNQSSQQNVQIRMCGHRVSLRYLVKKGTVVGQPLPSFPVPRFKTEPLLVIVMETLVNKKCTMVDVKSTEFHSVLTAEEKLQATQRLKAMRQNYNKNPFEFPKMNKIATLPAPITRPAHITKRSPSVQNTSQNKASVANVASTAVKKELTQTAATEEHKANTQFATSDANKKGQARSSVTNASKQGQNQTVTKNKGMVQTAVTDASKKAQYQTVASSANSMNKKAQNETSTYDTSKKGPKQTTKSVALKDKNVTGMSEVVYTQKGKIPAIKSDTKTSNTTAVKPEPTVAKSKEISMPIVLVENIAVKGSSPQKSTETMSPVITEVKSLAKSKISDRNRKLPSPQPPGESTRVTRSMRRSLQPQENKEVEAVKESESMQRRSLDVTRIQAERKSLPDKSKSKLVDAAYTTTSDDNGKSDTSDTDDDEKSHKVAKESSQAQQQTSELVCSQSTTISTDNSKSDTSDNEDDEDSQKLVKESSQEQQRTPERMSVDVPAPVVNNNKDNDDNNTSDSNQEADLSTFDQTAARGILSYFTPIGTSTKEIVASTAESSSGTNDLAPSPENVVSVAEPAPSVVSSESSKVTVVEATSDNAQVQETSESMETDAATENVSTAEPAPSVISSESSQVTVVEATSVNSQVQETSESMETDAVTSTTKDDHNNEMAAESSTADWPQLTSPTPPPPQAAPIMVTPTPLTMTTTTATDVEIRDEDKPDEIPHDQVNEASIIDIFPETEVEDTAPMTDGASNADETSSQENITTDDDDEVNREGKVCSF